MSAERPVPLNRMPVTTAQPGSELAAAQDELARQLDAFTGKTAIESAPLYPEPEGEVTE